ncbi:MAG: cytochrome d ubiquinol oxidase subunit II, partial [Calditrichaeota bacterium]|nr:cytochrome d ubiquinol oxidase subunit II [Calditrichota bacterium]
MLLSTAIGLFPVMLPSTNALSPDITIYNAANTAYGLNIALRWWILALVLVCGYFFYVHRVFRGKIALDDQIYESH